MENSNLTRVEVLDSDENLIPATLETGGKGVAEYKNNAVKQYHKGHQSLRDKMKDCVSNNDTIESLINEIFDESDNLLANHILASDSHLLKEAAVIQSRRAEVLKDIIKVIQSKQAMEKQNGLDIDSPAMGLVMRHFFSKLQEAMRELKYGEDETSVIINEFVHHMGDWKKDLKKKIEEM